MVDGIEVEKVMAVSQSKSRNVWLYNTVCTDYTWSLLIYYCTTTDYTWSLLTYYYTDYTWSPPTYCTSLLY
jgi:hypothetical protein